MPVNANLTTSHSSESIDRKALSSYLNSSQVSNIYAPKHIRIISFVKDVKFQANHFAHCRLCILPLETRCVSRNASYHSAETITYEPGLSGDVSCIHKSRMDR